MAKKKKEKYSSNIEWFDRFCPICDKKINKGEPSHHCREEDLIIEEEKEEDSDEEFLYGDKLDCADFMHNLLEEDNDIDSEGYLN